MSSQAVRAIFGAPGRTQGPVSRWLFEHESKDQFTTDVSINIQFEQNAVTTINVLKIDVN
jgi:hypothetical protein